MRGRGVPARKRSGAGSGTSPGLCACCVAVYGRVLGGCLHPALVSGFGTWEAGVVGDFRSERMPSPEGFGVAKGRFDKAWGVYSRAVKAAARPALEPLVRPVGTSVALDLMGFWVAWHLCGGFEGVQKQLGMSRSAVYRRIALFRKVMGAHPDEYVLPGVGLDVEAYLQGVPYGQATPAS